MDIIGYITDRNREELVRRNIGVENFSALKDTLNSAFETFAESIDPQIIEYLKVILHLRVPKASLHQQLVRRQSS